MHKITFHCETITPMFLSGADGQTPELRAPSIKGALRFWWRAVNGGKYDTLAKLKEAEANIFGGSFNDRAFKSKVLIRIKNINLESSRSKFPDHKHLTYYRKGRMVGKPGKQRLMENFKINILDYLAFGISDRGNINRKYITPNSTFDVNLRFLRLSTEQIKSVKDAFIALSQYGGLGSRSRNGFGGFQIKDNNKSINIKTDNELSSFTACSSKSIIVYEKTTTTWDKAVAAIGKRYQKARENIENWHHYDKRVLLTHPTIIRIGGGSKEVDETILENGRHSKPYFLHVEKVTEKEFRGQILCMPYNFLERTEFYSQEQKDKYLEVIEAFNAKLKQS